MKTVLLIGWGRGLGRVTAEKLAVAGHRVVLVARTSAAAETAAHQIQQVAPGVVARRVLACSPAPRGPTGARSPAALRCAGPEAKV